MISFEMTVYGVKKQVVKAVRYASARSVQYKENCI